MSNTMSGREAGEGSTPKKRSKTRSIVWEHFTKVNGGTRVQCNYCKHGLSYKGGTTTHLIRHQNSCNKVPNGGIARTLTIAENNERAAMNQPPMIAFGEEDRNFDLTPEKIWEFQVKNAILADFPIAAPNFKKVWSNLMVMDMEKEIWAYYQREKDKLVAELGNLTSRVCFSFKIMKQKWWISIAAHFINDDFNLVKRLIGFKKLPDYTSELCEADIIESCISDWKLGNKIFSFTTKWDDDLIGSFKEKFRSKMILDRNDFFIPCFKKAIAEFYSEFQIGISFAENNLVFFIKEVIRSPMGRLKFNEIAEEKGLPPINEEWLKGPINRYSGTPDWKCCYSAVKIVKEALLYKEVFCEHSLAEICQPSIQPDRIRWTELEKAVNFFETINPIIDLLSNSKYPTSNLYYPSYEKIAGSLDHKESFFSKPQTYHIMNALCVACVLDPRYKLTYFEYLRGIEHDYVDFNWPLFNLEVRDFFEIVFSRYAKEKTNQASPLSHGTANIQEGCPSSIFSDPSLLSNMNSYPLYIKELKTTKREMDQYLREEVIDEDTNFDLLGWWKENRSRYPILSRMARDLLAVPACAYSVKESLRIDLSALQGVSPEFAEALICSKNWILSDG